MSYWSTPRETGNARCEGGCDSVLPAHELAGACVECAHDLCDGCAYECADCGDTLCKDHVVVTPVPNHVHMAEHRCAACHQQRQQHLQAA